MTCSVHLAATIKGLMDDGGAIFAVRQIQGNTNPVHWYCSCRLEAEFHVANVGRDQDEPFPLFRNI